MAKLYRNSMGREQIRPSSAEVVAGLHARMNGASAVASMSDEDLEEAARSQANRQVVRELMAPEILKILHSIDAWRNGALCVGERTSAGLQSLAPAKHNHLQHFHSRILRLHMTEIRRRVKAVTNHFIEVWNEEQDSRRSHEYISAMREIGRRKSLRKMSIFDGPKAVLQAGFNTAINFQVNTTTAMIEVFPRQFDRKISDDELRELVSTLPDNLTHILTRTQMSVFREIEDAIQDEPMSEMIRANEDASFYYPDSFWIAEDTDTKQLSLELGQIAIIGRVPKLGLQPVNCAGLGRAVPWLHARMDEVWDEYLYPNLNQINASL